MKNKSKVKKLILSVVFTIISFVLFFYYKNGLTEYNSVLDKYLHLNIIMVIILSSMICLIFAVIWLILLINEFIDKRDKNTKSKKVISKILILATIILVLVSHITVFALQIGDVTVVNSIIDSVGTFVEYKDIFDDYDKNNFHEQTAIYKITNEILSNYEIEQYQGYNYIKTKCVRFVDNKTLDAYYDELTKQCKDYNVIVFNDKQIDSLDILKGFSYIVDNSYMGIIIVKNDKVFAIDIYGKLVIDSALENQIAAL